MTHEAIKRVTVYVPAYNAESYLEQCLVAIKKQDYPLENIVVINDGSTDRTEVIARDMNVQLINQETNKGLGAGRNRAFKDIDTPFIASLDADCSPEPNWLSQLMKHFNDPEIAGAGGKLLEKYQTKPADLWRARHMKQHRGDDMLQNPPFLSGSNNVFRRNAILAVGNYPATPEFRTNYEDLYISEKLYAADKKLLYTPDAVVYHLRRDTWQSVYHTSWRWYFNGKPKPVNLRGLRWRFKDNLYWALQYFKKDISRKDWKLIPVSIFYCLALSKFDLNYYIKNRREA